MKDSNLAAVIALCCLGLGASGLIVLAFIYDKWLGYLCLCVLSVWVGVIFVDVSKDCRRKEEAAKKEQK